jgi:7-carboxy-7-deazaguanine synthase
MYGTNPVAKPRTLADGFKVHSIFTTIQGEGPWAGYKTIFVRLTGCNLKCFFCDTEFEGGTEYTAEALVKHLDALTRAEQCKRLVLTGGEPMLQPIFALARGLQHLLFQVETAGSVWPSKFDDMPSNMILVCSPKTPKVHPLVHDNCFHWKYIIREGQTGRDGLPNASTQIRGKEQRIYRPIDGPANSIWVQPCDEGDDKEASRANMICATEIALKHNYRLSIQLHKIVDVE